MGDRKGATELLIKYVDKLLPGGGNGDFWREQLEKLSDAEFEKFIEDLESGERIIEMFVPNQAKARPSVERNFKIAEELGHDFFQQLWLTDPVSGEVYLTPIKYMVIDLPLRRQAQLLVKKISIPEHNKQIDDLTGQPTGDSKGSKISFPELQILYAQGQDAGIEEMISWRGGDEKGLRALDEMIIKTGEGEMSAVRHARGTVKSTESYSAFLTGMHLGNTLNKG